MLIGMSVGITATSFSGAPQMLPDIKASFKDDRYIGQTPTFAGLFDFFRATTARYLDETGVWQLAPINEARVDHHVWDGTKWCLAGILIEATDATNLLLGSAILATQTAVVTAEVHTRHSKRRNARSERSVSGVFHNRGSRDPCRGP